MKKLSMYLLSLVAGLCLYSRADAQTGITVCNCNDTDDHCTYVVTLNIQACNILHQCISLAPMTDTLPPDSCYTFLPPPGYAFSLTTASFSVSNTANSAHWTFGTTSTSGTGNCQSTTQGTTNWTVDSTLTHYTVCPDDSDTVDVGKRVEGIYNIHRVNNFRMYPNPSNDGSTNIEYSLVESQEVRVDVYNTLEQKVYSIDKNGETTGRHSIIIKGLKTGMYMVRFTAGNKVLTKKLIIQ